MGRYDQYSDEELIVRLREGETEISDYLMEKYKEFVRLVGQVLNILLKYQWNNPLMLADGK